MPDSMGVLTSSLLDEDSVDTLGMSMSSELSAILVSDETSKSIEEVDVRSSKEFEVMSDKKGDSNVEGDSVVAPDEEELLPISLADGEKVKPSIATDSSELCPDKVIPSSVESPSAYEMSDDEAVETGASVLIGSDGPAERDAIDDSPFVLVT